MFGRLEDICLFCNQKNSQRRPDSERLGPEDDDDLRENR